MDIKHYMIVDLEKRGDKRMFLTEQVATIAMNNNGFWKVRFLSSPRVFNYNHSRLLYLSNPEAIDIEEKDLTYFINNTQKNGWHTSPPIRMFKSICPRIL